MKAIPTGLEGVTIIEPRSFEDERGWLHGNLECASVSATPGSKAISSRTITAAPPGGSCAGSTISFGGRRGNWCGSVRGRVFDVAVDVRRSSPGFGRWVAAELSEDNRRMLWIPPGFAHGFLSLEEGTEFVYKCTDFYEPGDERTILWSDPGIGIEWPAIGSGGPLLSAKDREAPPLLEAETFA